MADKLPKIDIDKPVVIPAKSELTFDSMYIVGFALHTPTTGDAVLGQSATIVLRPYNADTGELYPYADRDEVQTIDSIWAEAARSTTFAQLFGMICLTADLIMKERRLLTQITATEGKSEDTTALVAALKAVREALGVQ